LFKQNNTQPLENKTMKFLKGILIVAVSALGISTSEAAWNTLVTVAGTSAIAPASNFKGQAVTGFKAGQSEVNYTEWLAVRTYAGSIGGFDLSLSGTGYSATAPVETLNWYDALKWCNAATIQQGTLTPVYNVGTLSIGSLTSTGTVATAIVPGGHKLSSGAWVKVTGATPTGYNLTKPVFVVNATTFTYPTVVSGTATATGTLVATVLYTTGDVVPNVDATATGYRLPSEKEWEWAALGGVSSGSYTYSGSNTSTAVAWSSTNIPARGAQPVMGKTANELSIYDMSGNVNEWCFDDATPLYGRRVRGGCWLQDANSQRTLIRGYSDPARQEAGFGFRVFTN
jgi:hypothetical protein